MKAAQFQRFLAHHSKKYGALTKGSIFKKTIKGRSLFLVASDKFNLLELSEMYRDFKMYAYNHSFEATWAGLIAALRKVAAPSINSARICHKDHEKEFLIWVEKLLEIYAFDESEIIKDYKRHIDLHKVDTELILPRALAAVLLYNRGGPVSLENLAAHVMLSPPTLRKVMRRLEVI